MSVDIKLIYMYIEHVTTLVASAEFRDFNDDALLIPIIPTCMFITYLQERLAYKTHHSSIHLSV